MGCIDISSLETLCTSMAINISWSVSFNLDKTVVFSPCCSPKQTKINISLEKSTTGTGNPGLRVLLICL